jgi:hypothetical protein
MSISIKDELSAGLGIDIDELGGWDLALNELDKRGQLNQRVIIELLLAIIKRIEETEERYVAPAIPLRQPTPDRKAKS